MYEEQFESFTYDSAVDGRTDHCLWHQGERGSVCILVLHGHGSHENQLLTRQDMTEDWTHFMLDSGFSVIAPNLRDNAWMSNAAIEDLEFILEHLRPNLRWRRLLVVSGSMGGTGGLIFAMRKPQWIDGVGVLGGATHLPNYLEWLDGQKAPVLQEIRLALLTSYPTLALQLQNSVCVHTEALTMPVVFVHGDADAIIPVQQARDFRTSMKGRIQIYKEVQGGGHDAPLAYFRETVHALLNVLK